MATAEELAPHVERLKRKIGHQSGPVVRTVEAGAIAKFAAAIGDPNPLYVDEAYAKTTRFGGIIAPPTFASCFVTELLPGEMFDFDLPLERELHSDDIAENDLPVRPGDVVSTTARYADVFVKEGKSGPMLFQCADLTSINQRGERIALIRMVAVSF